MDDRFWYRYAKTWPKAIQIVEAGVLCDVRTPVTHWFPIEEVVRVFEMSADPNFRRVEAIKVQIT